MSPMTRVDVRVPHREIDTRLYSCVLNTDVKLELTKRFKSLYMKPVGLETSMNKIIKLA